MAAPHPWNNAKAAGMIAPFGNFQVSKMFGRETEARRGEIGKVTGAGADLHRRSVQVRQACGGGSVRRLERGPGGIDVCCARDVFERRCSSPRPVMRGKTLAGCQFWILDSECRRPPRYRSEERRVGKECRSQGARHR